MEIKRAGRKEECHLVFPMTSHFSVSYFVSSPQAEDKRNPKKHKIQPLPLNVCSAVQWYYSLAMHLLRTNHPQASK